MIPDRLKKIIFRKLYDDLSHVEIIPFKNSIWFVDRDEKYWYFELQKDGTLWWRYQFFSDFFILFSLERDDYQSILAEWVEEVLNSRVNKAEFARSLGSHQVEEVLNSRVNKTISVQWYLGNRAEEVLNSRVIKTYKLDIDSFTRVEEVLNSKVNTTPCVSGALQEKVDEVLNSRVNGTIDTNLFRTECVEDVLNSRVLRTQVALHSTSVMAEGVLNCGDSAPTIGERLNHKVSQAKEGELFDESIVDTVLSSIRSV